MAILMANKDGTSNAQPGDIVVTGGGVYQKGKAGEKSILIGGLDTVSGKTGQIADVIRNYNNIVSGQQILPAGRGADKLQTEQARAEAAAREAALTPAPALSTGIVGFNPNEYVSSGGGSTSGASFGGYAIVALVGIVLLDKLLK